jgi:multidrug resistance efflux pump
MRLAYGGRLIVFVGACTAVSAFVGAGWAYWSARTATALRPLRVAGTVVAIVPPGTFQKTLRLQGYVEAARVVPVRAPTLAGPGSGPMVVTYLVPNGTTVRTGDLLVAFDRQKQQRTAEDTHAELQDVAAWIDKKCAELAEQDAKDATRLQQATSDVARAKLEMLKNEMLPRIDAQKNQLALDRADATLTHVRHALRRKRAAADLDIRILEVRRDRLVMVARQATQNAERMAVRSAVTGLVLYRAMWRDGQFRVPREGLAVWPGATLLDVVNPKTTRIRATVNQADVHMLRAGMCATVRLDAYPGKTYRAHLDQLTPMAAMSEFSDRVRTFTAIFVIEHSDPTLTPDLSAAVDVER